MPNEIEVEVEVQECDRYWCDNTFPVGEGTEVDGGEWCDDCVSDYAVGCDRCGELVADTHTVDGEEWCTNCTDDDAFWCAYCDCYYDPHGWSNEHDHDNGCLLDYNDTPLLRFRGEDPHGYYLGLELEMEDTSGCSISDGVELAGSHIPDHFYCKSDGSLYEGMEMVSHPMTLSYWQQIRPRFDSLTAGLRRMGMRSWNTETAGIHVHVSSEAFESDAHLWMFQRLFYRNPDQVSKFAGRESSRWAQIRPEKGEITHYTKQRKQGNHSHLPRYMAVNLTNRSTVEIRVFRGSLNPNRVFANLEFVHAAVEYTRTLTIKQAHAGALDFSIFAYWLRQQPQYANAAAHLSARGLVSAGND